MQDQNEFRQIQNAVDKLLNVKTIAKRKKKGDSDKKRELFFQIIQNIEEIHVRQNLLYADIKVDFGNYDEPFFTIIDQLIELHFGPKSAHLIGFYLYDRMNADGSINALLTDDGHELFLQDAYQLWELLKAVNPKLAE
jgi:hypothetical protein